MHNQTLTLRSGETITYYLEHRARRTVGLKITAEGLVVHAPKRIVAFQLNQILQEKSGWILNKLNARQENLQPAFVWQDGAELLYFGQKIALKKDLSLANKSVFVQQNQLVVPTKLAMLEAQLKRKVVMWYQAQALQDFGRRLEVFANQLGVATPPLTLSNAKSRWGSCNSRGEVRLNWRLLQAPPHIINYVICHELAHLKQMNHSAKFWAVVEKLFPAYKQAEKELKIWSPQLHRI
jgi:predicted metal-dependent hydrolase